MLKIVSKKATTDDEKQWLRQKFLEYKVKNGKVEILKTRMDIIPVSSLSSGREHLGFFEATILVGQNENLHRTE